MTPAPAQTSVTLVPVRPLRAGMLAYIAALAAIEMTAGVVVAFAWYEQGTRASVRPEELQQLAELFGRLRIIEAVVAAGAVITTLFWSFTVVRNASTACRNGRSGAGAVVSWALVPPLVLVLADIRSADAPQSVSVAVLVAQAAVMYLPFGTIAVASQRVGGTAMPFVRWYVALTLTFLVHEAFTGSFNLADPKPSHDLGRAAALMIASALVLGLMVIMAGEASQSMESATEQRVATHRSWREEALDRFRTVVRQERDTPRSMPTPLVNTRENVLVAAGIQVPMHAPQTVMPVMPVVPQVVAPQVLAPQVLAPPVVAPPVVVPPVVVPPVVAAPVVEAPVNSMFAPLVQRTFEPAPAPAVAPAAVVAPVPVVEPVVEPVAVEEPPAAAPPAAGGMFAPLTPRTTPRSL